MESKENLNNHQSASVVYVGDLSSKTLESDLFRLFSSVGEVKKIKLRKRQEPLLSYAFVTFANTEDASRAVKEYNNCSLNNKSIRVSHCVEDKIKKEDANVIVKNLPSNFTNENLLESFSMFGNIISAKIATYADGKLKSYGFVQFEKKKSAKLAIKHCDGGQLDDKIIQVELFDKEKRKRQDKIPETPKKVELPFTNCFIKNFPESMTEEKLAEMLSVYGTITSMFFPLKQGTTKTVGYAFANFDKYESCLKAIEDLHGKQLFAPTEYPGVLNPESFYIQKAQKKEEREDQLKKTFEQMSIEGLSMKRNLYVTNIPSFVEKKDIIYVFNEFGTITSISIGKDASNDSRKYAFICYKTPNEAVMAVEKGNEIYIDGNKLNVTYFKNKIERSKEKMMSSVSIGTNVPYIYNSPVKMTPNGTLKYDLFANFDTSDTNTDTNVALYEIILKSASVFKNQWDSINVKTSEEFSKRIYDILSKKSKDEIEEMEQHTKVLNNNISLFIEKNKNNN